MKNCLPNISIWYSKRDFYKNLYFQIFALASIMVFSLFLCQGNKGFNLWDEGFLWYGVQRVILGEVPIRDFMAYDPGRYYWSATLMKILSDNSIMALRATVAIFQALGIFIGLLLIARNQQKQNFFYLILASFTFMAWMYPRHKLLDISLSISLIGILAFLVHNPTGRRYLLAGMYVGLVTIFGRNHALYGAVGSIGVILWLSINQTKGVGLVTGGILWVTGVVIGFTPMLLMTFFIPGFGNAYLESLRFILERGSTNIPLPIPWPWRVRFASLSVDYAIRGVLVGLLFIGTIVFGCLSIIWITWQRFHNRRVSSELIAASFLAFPYAHYAYSRADVGHLAQGIFPLLIGSFVLLAKQSTKIKLPLAFILGSASLWVMHVYHPGWQCYISKRWTNIEISGSRLQVDPNTVSNVALLRKLSDKYSPEGQSFIAAPFWPGAYALLERKSPMWEIYALYPRSEKFQQSEIVRIKAAKPKFVLLFDFPLDGREELRFRNTHPLIYQYIQENFTQTQESINSVYRIYSLNENN